jgi:hypothetical protein
MLTFKLKRNLVSDERNHNISRKNRTPEHISAIFIFWIGYVTAQKLGLSYEDAAPAAMIGASNHFEVAIATAVTLFGLNSGAALATVVGVLIGVKPRSVRNGTFVLRNVKIPCIYQPLPCIY